jgi:hypothetical protein
MPKTCAPGIVELLRPVHEHEGIVVKTRCCSGLLMRHRSSREDLVIAMDASLAISIWHAHPCPGTCAPGHLGLRTESRNHSDTCAGCIVSATTPRKSAASVGRSTSSRSRDENSSRVPRAS